MKDKLIKIKNWSKKNKKTLIVLFVVKLLIKVALLGWLILFANKCSAQSTNKLLREGNKFYNNEQYNNATESYSKALQKAPKDVRGCFNQGDALFKLNQLDKAREQYLAAAKLSTNTEIQAKAYYNIGNAWYKEKKYEESAQAYKNSLKLNPKDEQAKYNLMMALSKIKSNGGGKNDQKEKDKKDQKKDKDKDKQQQDQKKDQQQNGKDPKDQQGQQDKDQQQKQQQQGQLTPEEAQKLLDAAEGEETKVQQKLAKEKAKPQKGKVQKDW